MSVWYCPSHGAYGGQITCPKCGLQGMYVSFEPPVHPIQQPEEKLMQTNRHGGFEELAITGGFQDRVLRWCLECFGPRVTNDKRERADRFIEEALELAQTVEGFNKVRALALVEYVFNRPKGDKTQEVGGVMVTLAALCNAEGQIIMGMAANQEMNRIEQPEVLMKVRDKQAMKRLIHNLGED